MACTTIFATKPEFDRMIAAGELLEWARVLGQHCYGTPRAPVEQALRDGRDLVFDIDWQGHRQLRSALPGDVVGVFVLPPSLAALDSRLQHRAGDAPPRSRGACAWRATRSATGPNSTMSW